MKELLNKFVQRAKKFTVENYIVLTLELLTAILLTYFSINFWIDIAKGITFFGEKFLAYEYVVTIIFSLLSVMMLVIFLNDLLFRDYQKEKNINKKVIKNGRVITIDKAEEVEEDQKK